MPDERDTQTAAPSLDGDAPQDSQATATKEPPEPSAASGAEAGEAPASPAPDPQPKSSDGSQDQGAAEGSGTETGETTDQAQARQEVRAEDGTQAEDEARAQEAKADAGSEPPETEEPAEAAAASEETPKAEEAPKTGSGTGEAEPATAEAGEVKTAADTGETTPAAAQTEPRAAAGEELQPEAAKAIAEETGAPQAGATAEEKQAAEGKAEEPEAETRAEEPKAEEPKAETETDTAQATPAAAAPDEKTPDEKAPDAKGAEEKGAEEKGAETAEAADKADQARAAADQGKEPPPPELDDPTLQELRKAKEEGTTITGKVIGWNRGGFHVVIDEVTAFCPASEMELGRPRSPDTYMDREMEFKVAKFQRRGRRVVLSRSEVLKAQRDEILANLKPGAVVKGHVTSMPDFGAFVDLGGVEGLVHVSEISRARVKKPSDELQMGQEVEVKILKIEQGGERISLSMKELEPDPWRDIADKYPRGSTFTGKILRHADFGMFVELEPDVEGLVHVSQLEPGQEMSDEALQPGNTIEGWIREVEPKRERISLSLREVPEEDPWKTVQTRFPEGETVEGTVESIAPFGVFIHLAPGLTGLLPNSQTGLPRGTSAARAFRPGQTVEIQVLSIDTRRKRISLGKPGARVEATKADLQEYRKQQKEQEKKAPSAMEAAFARLGLSTDEDDEG